MNLPGASSPPFRWELKRQCLNNRRNEQRLRPRCQRLTRLPSPSKELLWRQPMSTRNSTNRLPARHGLGDDPRLVLGTPRPPSPSPREDLVSTMLSEHSKPNGEMDTADSQNCSPGERWERNSAYVAGESGHVRVGPLSGPLDSFDLTCRNVICNRDAGEVAREGSWPSKESKDSNPRQCAWSGRDGEARWTDETWTPSISAFGRSIHCSAGIAGSARPSATCAKPHERPGAIGVRTRRTGEARQ
jgi:hypothetical protein